MEYGPQKDGRRIAGDDCPCGILSESGKSRCDIPDDCAGTPSAGRKGNSPLFKPAGDYENDGAGAESRKYCHALYGDPSI